MAVIGFLLAEDGPRPTASVSHQTPDGYAPYGVAGWIVDDGHLVCDPCARERYDRSQLDPLFADWEADYPGYTCGDHGDCCGTPDEPGDTWLPGTLLVYERDLPHLTEAELRQIDLRSDAPAEAYHAVARARREDQPDP